MKAAFFIMLSLTLLACSSSSPKGDLEEYPLREADKRESAELKRCLKTVHDGQEKRRTKTGKYYGRAADIPDGGHCDDFRLKQARTEAGYEIIAQFNEDDSTVRWSVNQDGVIEEHLDTDYDMDLEL